MTRRTLFALMSLTWPLLFGACKKKAMPPEDPPPPAPAETGTVPPVSFSSAPAVGSGAAEVISPLEQAIVYERNGQYWLARLVLERKALGKDGSPQELELLALICHRQGDETCIEECSRRLGRKLKFDGGAPVVRFDAGEHTEPDSIAARARDHLLQRRFDEARALLEPRVLDAKASKEELRLLRTVCKEQGDRMCVALCDAKLR